MWMKLGIHKTLMFVVSTLLMTATTYAADIVVNSNADDDVLDVTDSVVTLREAIEMANASPGLDTIRFAKSVQGTITLTYGDLEIRDDLKIKGHRKTRLKVSGNGESRVFRVLEGNRARISDLTVRDGMAESFGGGIFNGGKLTLVRTDVIENTAFRVGNELLFAGGGIYNSGTLSLYSCKVNNNTLMGDVAFGEEIESGGGGINNSEGKLNIYWSRISGNTASNAGGIRNSQGTMKMRNSIVANNECTGIVGGGMVLVLSDNDIRDSLIVNNVASSPFGSSGGISNESARTTLVRVVISGNQSSFFGGGVTIASVQETDVVEDFGPSTIKAWDSVIIGNSSGNGGGFALIDGNVLELNCCVVKNNEANGTVETGTGNGGGVWVGNFLGLFGDSDLRINHSLVLNNSASVNGGGIYLRETEVLIGYQSLIAGNSAGDGGGIYIDLIEEGTAENTTDIELIETLVLLNTPNDVVFAELP